MAAHDSYSLATLHLLWLSLSPCIRAKLFNPLAHIWDLGPLHHIHMVCWNKFLIILVYICAMLGLIPSGPGAALVVIRALLLSVILLYCVLVVLEGCI